MMHTIFNNKKLLISTLGTLLIGSSLAADSNHVYFNFSSAEADAYKLTSAVPTTEVSDLFYYYSCNAEEADEVGFATSGQGTMSAALTGDFSDDEADCILGADVSDYDTLGLTISAGRSDSSIMSTLLNTMIGNIPSTAYNSTMLNTNISALQNDTSSGTLVNGGPGEMNFFVMQNLTFTDTSSPLQPSWTCENVILGQQGGNDVKPVTDTDWIKSSTSLFVGTVRFVASEGDVVEPLLKGLFAMGKTIYDEIKYALSEKNTWWIGQLNVSQSSGVTYTGNESPIMEACGFDSEYFITLSCGTSGTEHLAFAVAPSGDSDDTFDICNINYTQ